MKRPRKHEQGKKRFAVAQIEEFRLKKNSLFFVVVKGKNKLELESHICLFSASFDCLAHVKYDLL